MCLTGAVPFGLLPGLVLSGRVEEARRMVRALREAFGEDRLFVELSDDGTAGSRRRVGRVAAFAGEEGLPVLATNEVAYLFPEDHRLHEVLVAASNLSRLPGPGYRPTDRLYLRSAEAMARVFGDRPEALRNAAAVAKGARVPWCSPGRSTCRASGSQRGHRRRGSCSGSRGLVR